MFPANLVQATFQQVTTLATQNSSTNKIDRYLIFLLVKNIRKYSLIPSCTQQYRTSIEYSIKPKPTVNQAQSESTTRRQLIYGIQDDNGTDIQNFALDLTPPPDIIVRTREGTSDGMNVLGIVIFSATMGEKEGTAIVGFLIW